MSVERGKEVPICPYWRVFVSYGGNTLALCGRKSLDEPPLQQLDGKPRLKECPIFDSSAEQLSFHSPKIIEVYDNDPEEIDVIETGGAPGKEGIARLEQIWDQEVEKFIERQNEYNF